MIAELRTFIAIARNGTFSAAAQKIGLTQAAVSGHVRRLEEHLGFTLFDREGRGAKLNAAGRRTLERALVLVQQFEALGLPEDPAVGRTLRLGAIASVQSTLLVDALARFHAVLPACKVQIVPGLSLHLLDQVDADELDVALIARPPLGLPPDLEWRTVNIDRYVLAAPLRCQGRTWQDVLRQEGFIAYDRLAFGGRQIDRFIRNLPFPVREVMAVPVQTMIAMVARGLGVALIPMAEAHLPLPDGVCILELTGADLTREIGLVGRRQAFEEMAVIELSRCLC